MVDELPPVYTSSFVDTKSHGSTLGEKNGSASASSNSIAYKTAVLLQKDSGSSSTRTGLRDLFRKTLQPDLVSASVRAAVLHDLRLVVEPYTEDSVSERVAVLKSCAQLCTRHKIKFSRLLQENLVGDHTVLYWAIANAPWPPRAPFALVAAVLAHSAPLQPSTIREARRACVSLRTQDVFQFFRTSPEFRTLSEEDRYILGVAAPPEEIVVEEMEGDAQPFSVRFRIPMFHKRMMLGKEITLEFVARGRLFQIEFFTANKPTQKNLTHGSWSGLLRMAENSPTTPAIFGLVFLDARPSPPVPQPFWVSKGKRGELLYVQSEVKPEGATGIISWSWPMFTGDSVCIAPDGSVSGILGMKLVEGDAPAHGLPTIPTTSDEQCVIC